MKTWKILAAAVLMTTWNGAAHAAQSWGVTGEETARFDAKVVDILCELTGDCAENCGDGRRQLGLLTEDGALVFPTKNNAPFAGAADELIEFCQQQVTVDGIFTTNHDTRVFAVQFVRPAGGEWQRANRFLNKWAESNGVDPAGKEKNSWFRRDPRVKEIIERDGFLGLGPEEDKKFLADY